MSNQLRARIEAVLFSAAFAGLTALLVYASTGQPTITWQIALGIFVAGMLKDIQQNEKWLLTPSPITSGDPAPSPTPSDAGGTVVATGSMFEHTAASPSVGVTLPPPAAPAWFPVRRTNPAGQAVVTDPPPAQVTSTAPPAIVLEPPGANVANTAASITSSAIPIVVGLLTTAPTPAAEPTAPPPAVPIRRAGLAAIPVPVAPAPPNAAQSHEDAPTAPPAAPVAVVPVAVVAAEPASPLAGAAASG